MSLRTLWIIIASIAVLVIAKENDEKWPRKFPFHLRTLMDKQELCESGYTDYENCDNYVSTGLEKSRGLNDLYEYNTGESNVDKSVDDIIDVEEKRSHRAGCECQLSSELIDYGAFTYPRFVRNVTCGGNNRCQHSHPREVHCLPIHYEVSVIKKLRYPMKPTESNELVHLPMSLRCCWRAERVQVVVGCVCGHKKHY